jgi:hypothetical protein
MTCQEEIEKECGFIETFVFRFTAVAALARRMRRCLPSPLRVKARSRHAFKAWRLFENFIGRLV